MNHCSVFFQLPHSHRLWQCSVIALAKFSFISNHFGAKRSKQISPNDVICAHSLELEHNKLLRPAFYNKKIRPIHWNFIHHTPTFIHTRFSRIQLNSIQFDLIYKFKYIEIWMDREFFPSILSILILLRTKTYHVLILFSTEKKFFAQS